MASALIVPLVMVSAPIWSQAADGDTPFSGADALGHGPGGTLFLRGATPDGFNQITGTNSPGPYTFGSDPRDVAPAGAQGVYGPDGAFYHVWKRQIVRYPVSGDPVTITGNVDAEGYSGDGGAAEDALININADDFGGSAAVAPNGDIYFIQFDEDPPVTEGGSSVPLRFIRKVSGGNITTIAGIRSIELPGSDSVAADAWIEASALAVSADGNTLFLLEDRSTIRKIDLGPGTISPFAGTGEVGSTGDGGAATAATLCATEIHAGPDGSVYAAMTDFNTLNGNQCKAQIRRILGGQISSVAGNGNRGMPSDNADALVSDLGGVTAITFDDDGRLVFSTNYRDMDVAGSTYQGWVYRIRANGTLENLLGPVIPAPPTTTTPPPATTTPPPATTTPPPATTTPPTSTTEVGSLPPTTPTYDALVPGRLMETRSGLSTIDGLFNDMGIRTGGTVTKLKVTGRHNIPADASAVALNVAVTETEGPGFITVYPCTLDVPTAANLNYGTGTTIPNAVVAQVNASGEVCFFTSNTTHLVVDVNGFFPASSEYASLVPGRLMETRTGLTTVDDKFNGEGIRQGGTVTELTVTGRHGIPADASAVVLNVAVTETEGPGFITVFPCGTELPTAANLNYGTGTTIPNAVIAKVGTGGKVCFFTNNTTHLVVDANGYFPAGSSYASLVPGRLMETRTGLTTVDDKFNGEGIRQGDTVTKLKVTGRHGIPADASAVVLNVAVTETEGPGFITVYPCTPGVPTAANLNYGTGTTIPNAVIAQVSASGEVCIYTNNTTHIVVDVNGYFA